MLEQKVVLVTGATSGMGAAAAILLAARGAKVIVFGRDEARANAVVETIRSNGGNATAQIGDVTQSATADAVVSATCDEFGRIDGLVNAAGIIHRGNAGQTSDAQWQRSMATNVDGSFYMSRAAVLAMTDGGSIVNFASTCGLVAAANLTAYCVTKGAIVALTKAMALDHARSGIRVNAVCPGAVDTPMLVSGHASGVSAEQILADNLADIPQQRIPQPEEIAELVAFLLSDRSAHITGTSIPIDGGYVAQ